METSIHAVNVFLNHAYKQRARTKVHLLADKSMGEISNNLYQSITCKMVAAVKNNNVSSPVFRLFI